MRTMTEVQMQMREDERLVRTKNALRIVLDFVERYNKQDKERDVAHAAQYLSELLLTNSKREGK